MKVYLFAIISRHRHTLTHTQLLFNLILENQYDTYNDKKVGIIQIIFHKVICFWVHEIFHFHENSLVVLLYNWYHCDDSVPAEREQKREGGG